MTTLQIVVVANYAALAIAGAALAAAHVRTSRRARVPALLFVGTVLALEAVEHALLFIAAGAAAPSGPASPGVYSLVLLARSISWLRLGIGWGLLLGARYALMPLGHVRTVRHAAAVVWQGYTRPCADAFRRLARAARAKRPSR